MNRLIIKLNTITENVTSELISKLYTNAKEIKDYEELNEIEDSQVLLLGNLLTINAYDDEVIYLETKFPNLHINVTGGRYIRFVDPEVNSILVSGWGDGVGITRTLVQSITNLNDVFLDNTSILHFDDLNKLTGLTMLKQNEFLNCSNLVSINLSGITSLETIGGQLANRSFRNCTSLVYFIAPQLLKISSAMCSGCTSLKIAIAKNVKYYNKPEWIFGDCPALKAIILPELVLCSTNDTTPFNLGGDYYHANSLVGNSSNVVLLEFGKVNRVDKYALSRYSPNIKALVLHGDNVMTLNGWSSGDSFTNWFAYNSMIVYVEDLLLPSYLSDTTWSEYYTDHVRGISLFNAADYLDQDLLLIYNEEMGTSYTAS